MKQFISKSLGFLSLSLLLYLTPTHVLSQSYADSTFAGFKLRSIGPAFMSGRIADIAIHPQHDNTWYVAVGSGGVWKTNNAGITWEPIFDSQSVYSIGCLAIDANNPHTVWVGTGENVGGRHVGYGDGIYKSSDGGQTWKNMGLKKSEHISKIIIHPSNSNIIYVAVQGPLWNKGGERGFYKSTDGGKTWKKTLGDDGYTGVTDIAIDPRNPDVVYAATWERHRNVAAYMGGGPNSGLHKSTDGGNSWQKLSVGLPQGNMGKIGLAISPQKPDVLYAAIELDRRTGGLYKSTNRGASWSKQSNTVSLGTGPHYYQELYACPHVFDRLYLADVRMQVSNDGGKSFKKMKEELKHSDNHALAFRKDDPNYLLVGSDGGLYESFDLAENWRYFANLPVTQFYKVAVDDREPFYHIFGGTQDNSTQGGPSQTDNRHGIRNSDWYVTLFGDGHQPATEPGNPNIIYSEWQEGNLMRIDQTTGEMVYIKPQPKEGEDYERYNWDAPILVSPHKPTRLYFASQRIWKSENRGDSWEAISGDLTRNQDRLQLPIMGQTQGWDAPWDVYAMSNYNTITSISESPLVEGLIYAGTDDGLIQVTEDGGKNWRQIEVGDLPGVPATAFVNDIKADLHNSNTVYLVVDNHKFGDLQPYLLKSMDKGKTWKSIKNNLPDRTLVWRIVQDHVKPELLFAATEFGIYFSINAGSKWVKITSGAPTISFRDLAIQKRENDLVGASFGRGFYVFDDYSPLRQVSTEVLTKEAHLFAASDAWWYIPRGVLGFSDKGAQGAGYYAAPNPPYGAVFTYYLKDGYKTKQQIRQEKEKALKKQNKALHIPSWEELEAERTENKPKVWISIQDANGHPIRRIECPVEKGFHRVAWDLRYPIKQAIEKKPEQQWFKPRGFLAAPGTYTATLYKETEGKVTVLSEGQEFTVKPLNKGALEGAPYEEVSAFWRDIEELQLKSTASTVALKHAYQRLELLHKALQQSQSAPGDLDTEYHEIRQLLIDLDEKLSGNRSKHVVGEKVNPTFGQRLQVVMTGTSNSTYGPTAMHKEVLDLAKKQFEEIDQDIKDALNQKIPAFEAKLKEAGAPWVEGQVLE